MNKIIFLFFVVFQSQNLFSQKTELPKYVIQYSFEFLRDSTSAASAVTDIMNLEYYENKSLYYSIARQAGYDKFLKMIANPPTSNVINGNGGDKYNNKALNEIVEYNFFSKQMSIYNHLLIGRCYSAIDTAKKPIWILEKDTQTVLGKLCQKATTNFRGRDYIAWYCSDIPINVGPWKFIRLPGVVLKAFDTKFNFKFDCISINTNVKEKPLFNKCEEIIKVSYSKLKEIEKIKITNSQQFSQLMFPNVSMSINGSRVDPSAMPVQQLQPYNPMELTY